MNTYETKMGRVRRDAGEEERDRASPFTKRKTGERKDGVKRERKKEEKFT